VDELGTEPRWRRSLTSVREEVTNLANVQERKNEEEEATENFAIMLPPI